MAKVGKVTAIQPRPAKDNEAIAFMQTASSGDVQTRPSLNWFELAGKEPPPRRWAIKGWLGFGHITLLVGPGGIGKTLLGQQIASSLALGQAIVGDVPAPQKSLMWQCEDEHDEIWRRQVSISKWLNAGLEAFSENLVIVPRHGLENTLLTTEFGRPMFTPLIEQLREQAADLAADVVILDNAAQLYGGNENDRHNVTVFLNMLAGILPGRAVLLLAHPARSLGSEFSGSSAWENVARTRLYLGSRLPDEKPDADDPPAEEVRYLSRRKANYSNRDWSRFTYRDGVLIPDPAEVSGGIVEYSRNQAIERILVDGLQRLQNMGIDCTESTSSPQFLPRQIIDYKLGNGHTKAELTAAMRRLRTDCTLERTVVGKYPNRSPRYGLRVVE